MSVAITLEANNASQDPQSQFQSQNEHHWSKDRIRSFVVSKITLFEELALKEERCQMMSAFTFLTGEFINCLSPVRYLWPALHSKANALRAKTTYSELTCTELTFLCDTDKKYCNKKDKDELTNAERVALLANYMRKAAWSCRPVN